MRPDSELAHCPGALKEVLPCRAEQRAGERGRQLESTAHYPHQPQLILADRAVTQEQV